MSYFIPLKGLIFKWSRRQDSNLRPPGPKPGALPSCATSRLLMVPTAGLEPARDLKPAGF